MGMEGTQTAVDGPPGAQCDPPRAARSRRSGGEGVALRRSRRNAGRLELVHGLDPSGPPRRRIPRLPEIDPLADDLAVAKFHDAHDIERLRVVVTNGVLVDPQV